MVRLRTLRDTCSTIFAKEVIRINEGVGGQVIVPGISTGGMTPPLRIRTTKRGIDRTASAYYIGLQ
jgi:hypothetical protein